MENNFTVYVHTLPNGKSYIGYLNMGGSFANGRTFDEIMDHGEYHKNRASLYADIQEYGWENVQTETILGLTKDQAVEKKKALCTEYQSYLPELGYNQYADAGLPKPPKVDKTPKGRLAKKIIKMFLHGDFTIYDHVINKLEVYTDDKIVEMLETISNVDGYIALSMTRRKFDSPYSEANYLLSVIDKPYCINRQLA